MVRAIYRTQKFIATVEAEVIAEGVKSFFPAVAPALLAAVYNRYQALRIWGARSRAAACRL